MDKPINYIALAIPVFFLLIGIELLYQKFTKKKLYRLNDSVANISTGVVQQTLAILVKGLLLIAYIWLYDHTRIFEFSRKNPWAWVLLFIGVDFFYYWFHRYAHEISIMWGGHIVHHQSEEYNLSVALRQGAFQAFFSWVFYLPLAVFGFDWVMFVVVNQFQTLYQFWIHTRAIDKMPRWFEFIFNTPSHHRVHHGINPKYIDKNHGGTFIIWDRLFGSFQPEEEEVVYGITKPLNSWNPVWANIDYFRDIFLAAWKSKSWKNKLYIFLKGPGWMPPDLGGPQIPKEVEPQTFKKFEIEIPKGLNYYALFQFVILLLASSVFLLFQEKIESSFVQPWNVIVNLGIGVSIFFSVMVIGGIFEKKIWARNFEFFRFPLIAILLFFILEGSQLQWILPGIIFVLMFFSLLWLKRFNFVFQHKKFQND